MKDNAVDQKAAVLTRLRSIARAKSADFQLILRRYAIERLLFRLSNSPYRDRFILKGAILFTAWLDDPFRPTHDLDLLGRGESSTASIVAIFREICRTAVEDDGLVFGINELDAKPIRRDQQHGGVRVKTTAFIAKTRIPVQVDIGFGDAVVPAAQDLEIPPLLANRGPWIAAYPKETVVAEKLQAIVKLGRVNSRMKDFYDLLAISRHFDFDGQTLALAIRATFERRMTVISRAVPEGIDNEFAASKDKQRQWAAFVGREPLHIVAPSLQESLSEITNFALPPLRAAASDTDFNYGWVNGGPWVPKTRGGQS